MKQFHVLSQLPLPPLVSLKEVLLLLVGLLPQDQQAACCAAPVPLKKICLRLCRTYHNNTPL